ncbi:MAG TPA: ATP-binding protein [Blastocatellia bacterium]|nr:ATP-binding protein [Blastocatellia bacterium]
MFDRDWFETQLLHLQQVMMEAGRDVLMDRAAQFLADVLEMKYVFVGVDPSVIEIEKEASPKEVVPGVECKGKCDALEVLAFYERGNLKHGVRYELEHDPSAQVLQQKQTLLYCRGVHQAFPENRLLTAWEIESYIGTPIRTPVGEVVGVVWALDDRPGEFSEPQVWILEIVARWLGLALECEREHQHCQLLQQQHIHLQKMETIGMLASAAAHDFNNLLAAIIGFVELARLQMGGSHPLSRKWQEMLRLCDRARQLVRQMLVLSRPADAPRETYRLRDCLDELKVFLERMMPENIEVRVAPVAETVCVEANPAQMQQVLINLAVNARDAMPNGGRLEIETKLVDVPERDNSGSPTGRMKSFVRITVSDTGQGIPPEIRPRIFEPFFTTKGKGKGTGLGLSIVNRIVQEHGGWIDVESNVGQGSRFHIFLPRAAVAEKAELSLPEDTFPRGTERILVVEDEPMVLELEQKLLESLGYEVLTARNGSEAVEIYRRYRGEFDLVLLDLVIPRMNGRHVLEQLRQVSPNTRVLFVTGYGRNEVASELLQMGAVGVLNKPYDLRTLSRTVRLCLDIASARSRLAPDKGENNVVRQDYMDDYGPCW